jgi:thioredoxin reductase (NADPH)
MEAVYDVIIIGGGPAGLAAGLYTSRAGFSTLILEKNMVGGELIDRELIENYPGYPDGILGPELGSNMARQATNHGVEIQIDTVEHIEIENGYKRIRTSSGEYHSKAVIVAGGAHPRKLGIPGEQEYTNKGVFYCATCDGPGFADKTVAVAGGGDSGITEALLLANLASRVIIIELMPRLSASKILQNRILSNLKAEIKCGLSIEAICGDEHVRSLKLVDVQTGQRSVLEVDGILVRIGLEANTDYLRGSLALDKTGQIVVNTNLEAEIAGVFAAGDIRHNSPMQVVTAVGDGATAALSVGKYLRSR